MAALNATYNDRPEYGEFVVKYKTDTPDCKPYYALRFGGGLSIFLNPDRMKMLEDVLAEARRDRELTAIVADQAAMGAPV